MDASRPRSPLVWLRPILVAAAFTAAGVATWMFFIGTVEGQEVDASTFAAVGDLRDALGGWPDRLRLLLPISSAALLGIAIVVALARRRWRAVIPAVVLPLLALGLSTALKDLLARPALGDHGYPENTFPSGHSAVTIACLIAFLWLVPRGRTVIAIPLALLATGAAGAQVVSYAHRLSDVIGGALLAGAIAACFLQRVGGMRALGRVLLWAIAAVAGSVGAWQLGQWMATGEQLTGVLGIILLSGAAATAALVVGAERAPSAPAAQPTQDGVGDGEGREARSPGEVAEG
jgi:membrane-associated phospholipid phosphatase